MTLFFHLRIFFPYFLVVLFFFLGTLPLGVVGLNTCRPMLGMMVVFYFATYRPYFFPYWFLFVLGMPYDAALGLPLGMTALSYILLKAVALSMRGKYIRAPFGAVWLQFVALIGGICLLQWVVMAVSYGSFFHMKFLVVQWLLSIAAYPFFHPVFLWVSRMTPRGINEEKLIGDYFK
jgi:rod shape-determining protein MreD